MKSRTKHLYYFYCVERSTWNLYKMLASTKPIRSFLAKQLSVTFNTHHFTLQGKFVKFTNDVSQLDGCRRSYMCKGYWRTKFKCTCRCRVQK